MDKVLLGMSGGVDSSVAALVLKEAGYEVAGVTLSLCGVSDEKNSADAKSVCQRLDIRHMDLDLKRNFAETVINSFADQYFLGNTPNPCICCNKHIKFGALADFAKEKGFSKIATGHYARIEKGNDGRYLLKKAKDTNKDQSYVLYCLTQDQLAMALFPLGELSKEEIRQTARENELVCADRPDSQDICFVPDGDYATFIERWTGKTCPEGNYIDVNGNILGKHSGMIRYTTGQRKGLGIALGRPQFVLSKNAENGDVVLGDEGGLFKTEVLIKDVNFIPFDKLEAPLKVTAKLRYSQREEEAVIYPEGERVRIVFERPQRAPSPGQSAVFYNGDTVVGGGIII